MELARVFSSPDVQTDRSIRFVLWNNEETGLNGARPTSEIAPACRGWRTPLVLANFLNHAGSA